MTRNTSQFLSIAVVAALSASSQLLMKKGMMGQPPPEVSLPGFVQLVRTVLGNPVLMFGWLLGSLAGIAWLYVVSNTDVSLAAPILTGLYFVFVLMGSRMLLGESLDPWRWAGVCLLVLGIAVVSMGAGNHLSERIAR